MNSNDRELLELAARGGLGRTSIPRQAEDLATRWNPLDEDEAALHLAVKLRMHILLENSEVTVIVKGRYRERGTRYTVREQFIAEDLGEFIATRRAIVRAAAELGKAIEGAKQ